MTNEDEDGAGQIVAVRTTVIATVRVAGGGNTALTARRAVESALRQACVVPFGAGFTHANQDRVRLLRIEGFDTRMHDDDEDNEDNEDNEETT